MSKPRFLFGQATDHFPGVSIFSSPLVWLLRTPSEYLRRRVGGLPSYLERS